MSKRRTAEVATPEPLRKRQRNNETHFPDEETVETTKELGEKIISLLKRSTDKNGRLIATEFLELPDRKLYPDYYEATLLPMSISMIEKKMNDGGYDNMTDLESDLKRMVQNAKDYNDSKSDIFEDAERIRKALSNFMPKHNPAYQDPEYRAAPTPIPDHVTQIKNRDSSVSGSEQPSIRLKLSTRAKNTAPAEPVKKPESTKSEEPEESEDHSADQLALLDELSAHEDAINFEKKPPRRDLPHYYKVIERPTSIHDVRKMVQDGKISSWDDFARETRLIWSNAKEYNEPNSVIYTMTEKLESWLEAKLQENGVPPKVVPRLSLKTAEKPRQLKLKLATPTTSTPTPAASETPSQYTVDQAALERQKREMSSALTKARDNSQPVSTPKLTASSGLRRSVSIAAQDTSAPKVNGHTETPIESVPKVPQPPGPTNVPSPTVEGVPPEHGSRSSPSTVVVATSTPMTSQQQPPPLTNGVHASPPQPTPKSPPEATNPIDRKHRDPHKTGADALIQSVTYMTSPLLQDDPKWKLTRHASASLTQTSYYTYLPAAYSSIRIIPELHSNLHSGKQKHKLFVINNGIILPATSDNAGRAVYDANLVPGENAITVEAISALKPGERKEYAKEWEQFDFERITFYMYLRPFAST